MSRVARVRERARRRLSRLPILLYHRIAEHVDDPALAPYAVTPSAFRRQMAALRRAGLTTIGAEEILAARAGRHRLSPRDVWVTFDDGYAELAEHAMPVLRANGQRATVFIASALVGGMPSWDSYPDGRAPALLDWPQLHELVAAGWDVGAHGREHRDLTGLDDAELDRELNEPRLELADRLGSPPAVLSYPFGAHDARVRAAAEKAGYPVAVSTDAGLSGEDPDLALRRVYVLRPDGLGSFAVKLATGMDPRTLVGARASG